VYKEEKLGGKRDNTIKGKAVRIISSVADFKTTFKFITVRN
jgi:hypothetical protein